MLDKCYLEHDEEVAKEANWRGVNGEEPLSSPDLITCQSKLNCPASGSFPAPRSGQASSTLNQLVPFERLHAVAARCLPRLQLSPCVRHSSLSLLLGTGRTLTCAFSSALRKRADDLWEETDGKAQSSKSPKPSFYCLYCRVLVRISLDTKRDEHAEEWGLIKRRTKLLALLRRCKPTLLGSPIRHKFLGLTNAVETLPVPPLDCFLPLAITHYFLTFNASNNYRVVFIPPEQGIDSAKGDGAKTDNNLKLMLIVDKLTKIDHLVGTNNDGNGLPNAWPTCGLVLVLSDMPPASIGDKTDQENLSHIDVQRVSALLTRMGLITYRQKSWVGQLSDK